MTINHTLSPISKEDRILYQAKRRETREKLLEDSKSLIQDFEDIDHWRALASKHNIRLPSYYYPATDVKVVRKYLKKLGIEKEKMKEYLDVCGVGSLQDLCTLNPNYPCYAEIGFALEWIEEKENERTPSI